MCSQERIDLFWERHFKVFFIPEVEAYVRILKEKVLKSFDSVEKEAQQIQESKYEELCRHFDPEIHDEATMAEKAFEEGLAHYEMMTSLSQGIINLFTVGLYHLFEQHFFILYRR